MKNTINQSFTPLTVKEAFRSMTIVYFAFLGGVLFLLALMSYLETITDIAVFPDEMDYIFEIVAIFFLIFSGGGSIVYPRYKLKRIPEAATIKQKMTEYRSVFVIRLAFLEGAMYLMLLLCMITGNYFFLIIFGILTLMFLLQKPSVEKAARELNLDMREKMYIENPDSVIAD